MYLDTKILKNCIFIFLVIILFDLTESKTLEANIQILSMDPTTTTYSTPIFACGEEFMETVCSCQEFELKCYDQKIENTNIEILKENFIVKFAHFKLCKNIEALKKGQVMPGREKTIEKLHLLSCNISYIENSTFDLFPNLKELNLEDNKLASIDEGILTKTLGATLLDLNLDFNEFTYLDPSIFKYMTKLEKLGIRKYFGIKKELFSPILKNLKRLNLGYCNITTLDDDFFVNLINLEELSLFRNPIITVPKAMSFIKNLRILDLTLTKISKFDKNTFGFHEKMKELYIFETNSLSIIDDCAFCNFPNLEHLELWNNQNLTFIHPNAFGSISTGKLYSNLKHFNIEMTEISTISERLFDWSKAESLYLRTNGYICDCSMAWLINDLQLEDSVFSSKVKYMTRKRNLCKNDSGIEITGTICDGKLSTLYHPTTKTMPSTLFKFYWIFLIGIIFGIGILCYVFHQQIIKFVLYRNVSQQENDETKLHHYYNVEDDDSASVSVF